MTANRNYKIEIGVSRDGLCVIGADQIKRLVKEDNLADSEYVYGVQIKHRVAVKDPRFGWVIMTPTAAKKEDFVLDGSVELRSFQPSR